MKMLGLSEDEVGDGAKPEEARERLVGGGSDGIEESVEAHGIAGVEAKELRVSMAKQVEVKLTRLLTEANEHVCHLEEGALVVEVADDAKQITGRVVEIRWQGAALLPGLEEGDAVDDGVTRIGGDGAAEVAGGIGDGEPGEGVVDELAGLGIEASGAGL
ncbi:MAG TPA: hypothetical protein VNM90_27800, partial [Haliangium sp.]|nr:hypothetical protein [Haliangium sp.]